MPSVMNLPWDMCFYGGSDNLSVPSESVVHSGLVIVLTAVTQSNQITVTALTNTVPERKGAVAVLLGASEYTRFQVNDPHASNSWAHIT